MGQISRIGRHGKLATTASAILSATAEMVMADLGLNIRLGSGVAAAQEVYRATAAHPVKAAA